MTGDGSSRRSCKKAREFIGRDEPKPGEHGNDIDREGAKEGIAPTPIQEIRRRKVEKEKCKQDSTPP